MELTNRLRRRFIKDNSLPIPLTDEPYFSYFMDLYDAEFATKKKMADFMEIVSKFETEEEVLDYMALITDKIINDVKENPKYQEFLQADMKQFAVKRTPRYPSSTIFKEHHTGKELISIDLSKANFQAMNYVDKEILNARTYREFVSRYTNLEHILNSKYIRQIIFGNLTKRIDTVELFMTYQIVEKLEQFGYTILLVTNDEVVLEGDKDIYENCVKFVQELPFDVAVEHFVLKVLRNEHNQPFKSDKFFVKEFLDYTDEKISSFEIKATDSTFYSQFYKLLKGMEVVDNDLVFINEGFVAMYREKISGTVS